MPVPPRQRARSGPPSGNDLWLSNATGRSGTFGSRRSLKAKSRNANRVNSPSLSRSMRRAGFTTISGWNWVACCSVGRCPKAPAWTRTISAWPCMSKIIRSSTATSKASFLPSNTAPGPSCSGIAEYGCRKRIPKLRMRKAGSSLTSRARSSAEAGTWSAAAAASMETRAGY